VSKQQLNRLDHELDRWIEQLSTKEEFNTDDVKNMLYAKKILVWENELDKTLVIDSISEEEEIKLLEMIDECQQELDADRSEVE